MCIVRFGIASGYMSADMEMVFCSEVRPGLLNIALLFAGNYCFDNKPGSNG
jgi:hypothetical protein